ncbi:hypothetical protein Bca52824_016797 [Brassica carinata]|uniref:RING-type E3 ubiquitin transferase n=1 Tax=Brassica carinata TaxID=52824 RepID=A0A8X7W5S8_BRACI|nr:hypothetical protein Bca52824_016797 [Brassica carinata]
MNPPQAIALLFFTINFFLDYVTAQSPPPPPYTTKDLFKPSLVITTGVFSVVFTLTFVLLIYAIFFHNDLRSETDEEGDIGRLDRLWQGLFNQSSSRLSGLNRTAIESLPFFRFSALKGSKQGLECSVCLSKFQDVEILRLLPKCKHAFHIECIDEWLAQHATCPLCRNRVCIEDELSVLGSSSNSLRIMSQEAREEDSNMEIYIEREEGEASDGSSRFSSFRKILKFGKNDKSLSLVEEGGDKRMHKFNHRIVVSNVVFKNRWSNVTSSDLTRLTTDMLIKYYAKDVFIHPSTWVFIQQE